MWLRMKDFYIFGVHWKIQFLGGVHEKPIYRGDCLKRVGLDSLQIQWGSWQEREGVFLRGRGGWYPNAHYASTKKIDEKIDSQLGGFNHWRKTSWKTFPSEKSLLSNCS